MYPWLIPIKDLVLTDKHGDWCRLPYPNHKHGCPNYGRLGCPPNSRHVRDIIDTSREMYFVHSEFNLLAHMARMSTRHPDWSERQQRNVLYWQGTSRKELRDRVSYVVPEVLMTNMVLYCPEGRGVNVYVTARKHGLILETIQDLKICRHVALLAHKKE